MPLCPQITNTPITVTLTADFTVTDVIPVLPANTEQLDDVIILADGKTKAFYQTTAPTVGVSEGDIWFDTDDGNKQYYYNGTAWVSVQDTAIAAAQSAATAAQTTADGKNRVYRQTSQPTGGTYAEGDLWFDTDDDNKIYRYTSGSWGTAVTLGYNALASISANKITAGTIDASVITVSNINAGNISTGNLSADRIASASITGTKIAAGTILASNIATGTITATQIAAGTITATQIAAGTITTDKLVAGTLTGFLVQTSSGSNSVSLVGSDNSLTFKNGGSNVGHILPLSSNGVLMHYGATADGSGGTFPQMFVGSANASMFASSTIGIGIATGTGVSINGNTALNNQTTYPGVATGAGTAMVVVTTGSRIAIITSSERFKEQIQYINTTGWLDKVLAMKPITYKTSEDFTTEGEPNETQIGFLAEDIYDIGGGLEKAVVLDPLGDPFSLSYDRLTVFLMLAIKELKAEIDQLKGE
jgi:hypothetical protein